MAGFTPRVRKVGDQGRGRLAVVQGLVRQGRLAEAEEALATLRAEAPQAVPVLVMSGRLLHKLKRPAEAIPFLEQAVALAPMDLEPTLRCARAHLDLGTLDRAEALFATARNLDPRSAWARVGLGLVAARSDRPDDALAHLVEAVRLDPSLTQARLSLARLLRSLQRNDEAAQQLKAVLDRHPDHPQATVLMVQTEVGRNQPEAARGLLQRLIARAAGNRAALRQAARTAQRAELYPEMEQACRALLADKPTSASTRIRLIQALIPQGQVAEAKALLDGLPRRRSLQPLLSWLEGDIARAESRVADAEAYFRAALLALPDGAADDARITADLEGMAEADRLEAYRTAAAPALRNLRRDLRRRRDGAGAARGAGGRSADPDEADDTL